ncbi:MAG TPA: acyl-CoA dehydratase activase [Deltaproteobacteria bacterium]|nr:acyl-CoA dehydratase activase [Deltaproteobacteria bacterium]
MIYAGIDIGSTTTKGVIIDSNGDVLSFSLLSTMYDRDQSGSDAFASALDMAGRSEDEVGYLMATGYGRRAFQQSDDVLPEIVCHARGTRSSYEDVRTIIDIGGQDSKIIQLDGRGLVTKFEMNDKCAAGTGRFFEVLTGRLLNISLDDLGPLSLDSKDACVISSMCTVFAESEIISFLSEGRSKEDIVAGMHRSVVKRIVNMGRAGQITFDEPIVFTGGAAQNIGMVKEFEDILGKEVLTIDNPQSTAALGAALFALDRS